MQHTEKVATAKKAIIEARKAGGQEMSIRRTNTGIAGSIATKISNREKWIEAEGRPIRLSTDEQAERLADWLTDEEAEYIAKNW